MENVIYKSKCVHNWNFLGVMYSSDGETFKSEGVFGAGGGGGLGDGRAAANAVSTYKKYQCDKCLDVKYVKHK